MPASAGSNPSVKNDQVIKKLRHHFILKLSTSLAFTLREKKVLQLDRVLIFSGIGSSVGEQLFDYSCLLPLFSAFKFLSSIA